MNTVYRLDCRCQCGRESQSFAAQTSTDLRGARLHLEFVSLLAGMNEIMRSLERAHTRNLTGVIMRRPVRI